MDAHLQKYGKDFLSTRPRALDYSQSRSSPRALDYGQDLLSTRPRALDYSQSCSSPRALLDCGMRCCWCPCLLIAELITNKAYQGAEGYRLAIGWRMVISF